MKSSGTGKMNQHKLPLTKQLYFMIKYLSNNYEKGNS